MGIEDLIQTKSFNLEVCTVIEGLVNFFDRSPRTVQHMLLDSIQCSFLKIIVNAFSERRFLFTRSLPRIQNKGSRKKPKNLTWSYDENISVYESASGNKQRSKPMKVDTAFRSFPHRIDCWIIQFFENSTFAFVSISSESLLTGAVERSLGICGCRIVSAIVVGISSTFTDV